MNTTQNYQEKYTRAKARVGELRSFYNHLFVYLIVNTCIASFNYYVDGWQIPWFLFPLAGWGIGLLGHAMGTFGNNILTTKGWEERKIQELMERDQ
ncbi:MAG: 2TM domain-containing protein [Nonlabens sp.]